jgi:hypothetical protein
MGSVSPIGPASMGDVFAKRRDPSCCSCSRLEGPTFRVRRTLPIPCRAGPVTHSTVKHLPKRVGEGHTASAAPVITHDRHGSTACPSGPGTLGTPPGPSSVLRDRIGECLSQPWTRIDHFRTRVGRRASQRCQSGLLRPKQPNTCGLGGRPCTRSSVRKLFRPSGLAAASLFPGPACSRGWPSFKPETSRGIAATGRPHVQRRSSGKQRGNGRGDGIAESVGRVLWGT